MLQVLQFGSSTKLSSVSLQQLQQQFTARLQAVSTQHLILATGVRTSHPQTHQARLCCTMLLFFHENPFFPVLSSTNISNVVFSFSTEHCTELHQLDRRGGGAGQKDRRRGTSTGDGLEDVRNPGYDHIALAFHII